MGFEFGKSYAESLFKKWCVTSTPPNMHPYVSASFKLSQHTAQPCKHSHNVLSTCKVCTINGEPPRLSPLSLSGLFPDLHLPTSVFAVPTSRTASKLCVFYLCPLGEHIRIGTPQGTSGGSGSVISPYCHSVNQTMFITCSPF